MRGGHRLICLVLALMSRLASAQDAHAPHESVTVTGTRSPEVLRKFVDSLAAPTRLTGKMARWKEGICPVIVGLKPGFVQFIDRRLKQVAAQVGAPVSERASCRTNIEIVFTTTPQELVDNVHKKRPFLLGYFDGPDQETKLATVVHPIQAWYVTATRDVEGGLLIDNAKPVPLANRMEFPCDPLFCVGGKIDLYPPRVVSVTGSRLGDGLRSEFYNIAIVIDPTKLLNFEIGELADYIAMLALTQLAEQGGCRTLPSVANLLAEDCATKADVLTDNDRAFLRGLYKMSPDMFLAAQKDQVSYEMERALNGR
jgi:hypothetical protein